MNTQLLADKKTIAETKGQDASIKGAKYKQATRVTQ